MTFKAGSTEVGARGKPCGLKKLGEVPIGVRFFLPGGGETPKNIMSWARIPRESGFISETAELHCSMDYEMYIYPNSASHFVAIFQRNLAGYRSDRQRGNA